MVKRNAVCALIAALVALLLPWLAVTLVRGDGGMAVCFLLFFAVNPVTAILLGVFPAEISVGHGSSRCHLGGSSSAACSYRVMAYRSSIPPLPLLLDTPLYDGMGGVMTTKNHAPAI